MMIPPVRRTWALLGQTPIVRHYYRRDRISVIGGLSVSPARRRLGLYFRMHPKNISQEEVYDFLWYLLRHLRGQVTAVWADPAAAWAGRSRARPCRDRARSSASTPAGGTGRATSPAPWHTPRPGGPGAPSGPSGAGTRGSPRRRERSRRLRRIPDSCCRESPGSRVARWRRPTRRNRGDPVPVLIA